MSDDQGIEEEKIAFLRCMFNEKRDAVVVQAFIADIPSEDAVKTLVLRGPITIPTKGPNYGPYSFTSGHPVYDYEKQEIIWPFFSGPWHAFFKLFVRVWRLGRHFSLSSVENTSLEASHDAIPSVLLENQKLSVGVSQGEYSLLLNSKPHDIVTARRGPDHQWTRFPFHTTSTALVGTGMLLYKPPSEHLHYIFCIRPELKPSSIVHIDILHEEKYAELGGNNAIQWQHFAIDMGFPLVGKPAAVTIPDQHGDGSRLYLFKSHSYYGGVSYAYVPLRKDGSINSYKTELKASGLQTLKATIGPDYSEVQVLESKGRLIMLLDNLEGQGLDQVYSGFVKDDGSAPNGDEWTKTKVDFESDETYPPGETFSYSAVVVPAGYE